MIGFAVFGAGRMGQLYIDLLNNYYRPQGLAQVMYVVAGSRSKEALLGSKYGIDSKHFKTSANYKEALEDDKVTAVLIASPSSEHEKQILDSLKYGKQVYCEKPISSETSSVVRCFDLAVNNNLWLFCAMQRKFDSQYRSVFESSHAPEFGNIVLVKSCSRDHTPPSLAYMGQSGGIICDSVVHDIDLCCWFVGDLPTSVYAAGSAHRQETEFAGDLDVISLTMKFKSGAIAVVDISRRAAYGYDQRLEVLSSNGQCLRVDNALMNEETSDTGGHGMEFSRLKFDDCVDRYSDAYKKELDHFIARLHDEKSEAVFRLMKEENDIAIGVCKVVEAANLSVLTGEPQNLKY